MSRGKPIKEIDEFPRRIKIFISVIICLILFGTIGFTILTEATIEESAFRTLQTLAFIFSDESTVFERFLEIFLAIIGVFLIWWVLWSVADMLLDRNLERYINLKIHNFKMAGKKNHIIIVGGGRIGSEIALNFSRKKKSFVIVENNPEAIKELKSKKYSIVQGNAEEEKTLLEAGIEKASKIILTLPKAESNILITLTSKELNSKIDVYSRANEQKFVSKLKKAGAKKIIVPEILAGDEIAEMIKD